jgi:hypothetical protein
MVDAAYIQAQINYGFGIVAQYLGVSCNWYRPTPSISIDPTTLQGTLMVAFDPKPKFEFSVPSSFAHPQWFVGCDRTNLLLGDYLVTPDGSTYFINALQAFSPTGAILCNATVTIYAPAVDQTFGPTYYGGNVDGLGSPVIQGCHVSILQGTKGETDNSGVISEARQPWAAIVMPNLGVPLYVGFEMIDDQNRRYQLSSIETTELGIRITAQYSSS